MNVATYRRLTDDQVRGRLVRTADTMSNAWGTLPTGTLAYITRTYTGFTIETPGCPCCGLRARIGRVDYQSLHHACRVCTSALADAEVRAHVHVHDGCQGGRLWTPPVRHPTERPEP